MIDIYIMKKFHMYMSFFPPGLQCTIVYLHQVLLSEDIQLSTYFLLSADKQRNHTH